MGWHSRTWSGAIGGLGMVLAAQVGGCAVVPQGPRSWSEDGSAGDVPRLAAVVAETVRASLPGSVSVIAVAPADGPGGRALDEAVRAALAGEGFSVAPLGAPGGPEGTVRYAVTGLGDQTVLRLDLGGAEATCVFGRGANLDLVATAPCSVRNSGAITWRPQLDARSVSVASAGMAAPAAPAPASSGAPVPASSRSAPATGPSPVPEVVVGVRPAVPEPKASVVVAVSGVTPTAIRLVPGKRGTPAGGRGERREPAAAPARAEPPETPPSGSTLEHWVLKGGELVGRQLVAWGQTSGWTVLWQAPVDWPVPATTEFYGPFPTVAETVITALRSNGADIRGRAYLGNATLVVTAPGGTPQESHHEETFSAGWRRWHHAGDRRVRDVR